MWPDIPDPHPLDGQPSTARQYLAEIRTLADDAHKRGRITDKERDRVHELASKCEQNVQPFPGPDEPHFDHVRNSLLLARQDQWEVVLAPGNLDHGH